MTRDEATALLSLARARNLNERKQALELCVSRKVRLPDDFLEEAKLLFAEARQAMATSQSSAHALRPLVDPTAGSSFLTRIEPGPDPILPQNLTERLQEWSSAWLRAPELRAAGIEPPGPLLLFGPPGTGKSTAVAAIATQFVGVHAAVCLDAHRVLASHLGETGANLHREFQVAERANALLVLEEIDALGILRGDPKATEVGEISRITIAIMRLLDQTKIPVILTTNRFDRLDAALIRRCEYGLEFPEPSVDLARKIVSRELGEAYGGSLRADGPMDLTTLVPWARRARRLAFLRETVASDELEAIVRGQG
jgi:SpoVK/Ycf46/Vps4 family AAA+-type ATPase